jgi:hypothetical protein
MDLSEICRKIGEQLEADLANHPKWRSQHTLGELALEAVLLAGLTVSSPEHKLEITTDRK